MSGFLGTPLAALSAAHFLTVSTALFAIGLISVLINRHAVRRSIGVVLMLAAANLNFMAFSRYATASAGIDSATASTMIVMGVSVIEVAVALAIAVRLRHVQAARAIDPTRGPATPSPDSPPAPHSAKDPTD